MDPDDIVEKMAVALAAKPSEVGVVLKRQGMRVRVDFSQSGGKKSAWVTAKDLVAAGGGGSGSDDEVETGVRARSASPVPVPLTERYEAKLGRSKVELEVMGIGLQTFNKRGKPEEKFLYQNLSSWEPSDKGCVITMATGDHRSFAMSGASATQVCAAMTEKATELSKVQLNNPIRRGFSVDEGPDFGGFLESKGHGAFTLRVKDAMANTGIVDPGEMVELLRDMNESELADFVQACANTTPPSVGVGTNSDEEPPPPPPPEEDSDSEHDEQRASSPSFPAEGALKRSIENLVPARSDDEEENMHDVPMDFQMDEKFEAKWKRKAVYVSATGMSLQVSDRKTEKPLENYMYQKCQTWQVSKKGAMRARLF
jgi:hypothetical protein